MDLTKASDTIHHLLRIAKLSAYGFSKNSFIIMNIYLTNRFQRTNANNNFRSWKETLGGVSQG